jgi:hypothetical protein
MFGKKEKAKVSNETEKVKKNKIKPILDHQ